jgi:hypothetical protein
VEILHDNRPGPLSDAGPVEAAVKEVPEGGRIWFLQAMEYFHDPDGLARKFLDSRFHKAGEWVIRKETGFRLVLYER